MFLVKLTFRDAMGETTTITHQLITNNYEQALIAANDIRVAYSARTDAVVASLKLEQLLQSSSSIPSNQNVTIAEEALIFAHLRPAGDIQKLATLRIPSPQTSVFLSDKKTVSQSVAENFVQAVAQYILVSDGETIETGNNGGVAVPAGYLRYRAKRYN